MCRDCVVQGVIVLGVGGLQRMSYVVLQLSRLEQVCHESGCELARGAAGTSRAAVGVSFLSVANGERKGRWMYERCAIWEDRGLTACNRVNVERHLPKRETDRAENWTYVWLAPYASFFVPSTHPQRTPGPAILENEPLEQALPKPSAPSRSAPPSMSRSTSTRRGR